jgi:hypothetical protein
MTCTTGEIRSGVAFYALIGSRADLPLETVIIDLAIMTASCGDVRHAALVVAIGNGGDDAFVFMINGIFACGFVFPGRNSILNANEQASVRACWW